VLWSQLTGDEPLIDKLFPDVYAAAFELGMMLSISSNGSRLATPGSSSCSRAGGRISGRSASTAPPLSPTTS
jgi:molybdenum cofactor biosynthesis enzyme MoaA